MARRLIVEIVGDASSLQRSLGNAAAASTTFGDRMQAAGAKISSVGKSMTEGVTVPIVGIAAASTKAAVDFQDSMEKLHTQAGVSQQAVDSLSKSVLAMAGNVATAPEELSQGLFHLASQGLRGKQALDALKIAAEGAKVGGANLEDVTNALGASIVSGIKGSRDFTQTMGQLNAIVGAGDMHMQDLADALGTGLPAKAAIAGVSLRDVGAALAVFGDNNIRGAQAGTLLNSTLRLMAGPSSAAAKAMGAVGLSATQLGEDLRSGGIVKAVSDLKDHLAGLSKSEQFASLTHMFGGKQAGGVMILIDQLERLRTKVKEVDDGGSTFAANWEAYTKTTAYHLASMGAQMHATGITIGDVLLPVVTKIVDVIGRLGQAFDNLSPHTRRVIEIVAGVAAVIGPIAMVVGPVIGAVGALAGGFMALTAAVAPVAAVIGAPAAAIAGLVVGIGLLVGAIAAAVLFPKQFESALEHMGVSAQTAGEIVGGLRGVFAIVEDAVRALMPIIDDAFKLLTATFRNTFTVIKGVVDIFAGLLHGDWSRLWKGIEEIASGVFNEIGALLRASVNLLGDLAHLIGEAIWKGIVQPIVKLAGQLLHTIEHGISAAFHDVIGWVTGEAEKIGKAIVDGIAHGVTGLAGSLFGSLKHGLGSAMHSVGSFLGIGSPSRVFAEQIGQPIAQGIIVGYLEGIRPLTEKMTASIRGSLEQARATVRAEQGQLADAWRQLADNIVSAFDKETQLGLEQIKSKLAKQLAEIAAPSNATSAQLQAMQQQDQRIQLAHDLANATQAVTDAQTALNQAQASGDPTQVAAAQQQLADAEYNLTMVQRQQAEQQLQDKLTAEQKKEAVEKAAAEKRAKTQETNYKAERERSKKNLEDQLRDLGTSLEKGRTTWAQAHTKLMEMLKAEGIDYQHAGRNVGEQIADGIKKSMGTVESAMQELTKLIASYLPHSPAERGPLSKPLGWGSFLLGDLGSAAGAASSLLSSTLSAPSSYGVGAGAPRTGGSVNVNIRVDGFVGNDQDLADKISTMLIRQGTSGHPLWRQVLRQAMA